MTMPPPPLKSPKPDVALGDGDEPITGSFNIPATLGDIKRAKQELASNNVQQARVITKMIYSADVKWFLGIIVVVIIGTAATIAWGQTAIEKTVDAGIAPVKIDLRDHKVAEAVLYNELKTEVQELKRDVKDTARESQRTSVMVQMLLENRGLTPPPKIAAADGGR